VALDIDWDRLSEKQCEDLITALLTELYPHGRRIDGRGGDGGRDYEVPVDGGWHRFEVKSWSEQFGKSQKQQLKASLQTTLRANPVRVTVVVPLDETPGMVAWLDRQQATTSVPLEWWGRTWLETHLAARPHLVRAFARTSLERTLERLAEYHAEQAVLPNGVPDAIERFQRLLALADETDEHYRFRVEAEQGQTIVSIIPRTERSLEQHPITVSAEFAFPADDPHAAEVRAALARSFDFGDPVTVPPEYVAAVRTTLPAGLGKELASGATIAMGPTETIPWDREGRAILVDATGRTLQHLPVRFTSVWGGQRGVVIDVEDPTGCLRVRFRAPKGAGRGEAKVRLAVDRPVIPADLLSPLRFFEALRTAARLRLWAGTQELFSIRMTPVGELPSASLGLMEALARLQEHTSVLFPMPTELTVQEAEAIFVADTLLRDGQVVAHGGSTNVLLTRGRARWLLEAFPTGQIALWQPNEPFAIRIAGHEMPLGLVSIHSACARFDVGALRRHLAQPMDPTDELLELPVLVHAGDGLLIRLVG
jgi:hypothetical protein